MGETLTQRRRVSDEGLQVGDNYPKGWLIPHKTTESEDLGVKDLSLEDESA